MVPLRLYGLLYICAGEVPRGGAAARQKSKDPLDFWMKVWTKAMGRFPSAGAGFRGLYSQKSKNPKKIRTRACAFPLERLVLPPASAKIQTRTPFIASENRGFLDF